MTIILHGDLWLVDGLLFETIDDATDYLDWLDNQPEATL